jgi:hypothetical protein
MTDPGALDEDDSKRNRLTKTTTAFEESVSRVANSDQLAQPIPPSQEGSDVADLVTAVFVQMKAEIEAFEMASTDRLGSLGRAV